MRLTVAITPNVGGIAARDEPEWLTRYSSGWPLHCAQYDLAGPGPRQGETGGGTLLRLQPGDEFDATLRFQAFTPAGPVTGLDAGGRALAARNSY